jgi:hypothetical protein
VNPEHFIRRAATAACAVIGLFAGQAFAGGEITRAFSGIWDQPDHQSQGFIIQISEDESGNPIGVTYWFTYDGDLASAWYLAIGPVVGHQIDGILYKTSGVTFLEDGIENNAEVEEIGTLLLSFRNCNQGTAAFETEPEELGSGEVRIKRLTSIYNMRCSGGISDNTPGDARPLQLEVKLRPVDPEGEGEGKAKFWERPGRSDLKVTVDDLAVDGTYTLEICGTDRGDLVVEDGEGNLMFRSPSNPGKKPLNFEPRECPFEILLGETVVLTSGEEVLAPKQPGDDDDDSEDSDDNETEIEIDLDPTGNLAGARGSATYELDDERESFKVRLRNVPVGAYRLYVAGDWVGDIDVEEGPGNSPNRGELRFSKPVKPGEIPLDFEVLGKMIEIRDDEDLPILTGMFPMN